MENNNTIIVTQLDYERLSTLIENMRGNKNIDQIYIRYLNMELQRAQKVDSSVITPDFVTMNSVINVKFTETDKSMDLRLVYPQKADFSKGLISVLSPLGCALLGYKEGDIVEFKAPKGIQTVKIEKVIFQPEANGEDLL